MHVAFFTTGMTRGGAERVISTVANCLSSKGIEVSIVMLKGNRSEYYLDSRVKLNSGRLEPGLRNGIKALSYYVSTMKSLNPDVIIAFTGKANQLACLANRLKCIKTPLIISERADPFSRSEKAQGIHNTLYRSADMMVCQSEVVASFYRDKLRGVETRVISNPVDLACVAEIPGNQTGKFILSVGRLCPQKRHDVAIKAFFDISADYPDIELRICGVGEEQASLEQLAESLGISKKIHFEGSVEDVMRKFSSAKAFLMTSDFEGFPNAMIEALCSGLPVVSTDFSPGVARELVTDGRNGYVVDREDTDAVSAALKKVLEGRILPDVMADCAESMKIRFSTDTIVPLWGKAIEDVLNGVRR